jgi:hypothetical protein
MVGELLEMLQHRAPKWFRIAQLLHVLKDKCAVYTEDARQEDHHALSNLANACRELDLTMACVAVERLRHDVLQEWFSEDQRVIAVSEIERRILDEMETSIFLHVPREWAKYYQHSELFGPGVRDVFQDAAYDIEEAGKCLATARATACVFHLMRVMEVVLRHLSKRLGIPFAPSWESHIQQIPAKISQKHKTKGIQWKRDEPFFREVLGDIQAVKIAWRNPTMHVRSKYTVEEADDIFRAVRRVAQRLAAEEISKTRKSVL